MYSILPVDEKFNPSQAGQHWLHKDWLSEKMSMHYLLCEHNGKRVIMGSSGSAATPLIAVGTKFSAREDQSGRPFRGEYTVVKAVDIKKVATLGINKLLKMYVFK